MKNFIEKHAVNIRFILGFFVFSLVLAIVLKLSGLFDQFNQQWVDETIATMGVKGTIYFIIVISFAISIGLPRQVAAFAAGYAFGVTYGTLTATFAAVIGCCITFGVSRFILRPIVSKRFANKIAIINRFLQHKTFQKAVIIRLIPAGNNFLLNVAAGIGKINPLSFIGGSYVGYFPQMAIFALAGSGVQMMSYWQIGASAALSVVAILLSVRLYRQYQIQ